MELDPLTDTKSNIQSSSWRKDDLIPPPSIKSSSSFSLSSSLHSLHSPAHSTSSRLISPSGLYVDEEEEQGLSTWSKSSFTTPSRSTRSQHSSILELIDNGAIEVKVRVMRRSVSASFSDRCSSRAGASFVDDEHAPGSSNFPRLNSKICRLTLAENTE